MDDIILCDGNYGMGVYIYDMDSVHSREPERSRVFHLVYIISEETPIFAPQRPRFYRAANHTHTRCTLNWVRQGRTDEGREDGRE